MTCCGDYSKLYLEKSPMSCRVCSFGMIWIGVGDLRLLRPWYIKGTDKSLPRVDSSVPLVYYDLSDRRSRILIWTIPMERSLD